MTYNTKRTLTSGMELLQNMSESKLWPAQQAGSLDPSDLYHHRCWCNQLLHQHQQLFKLHKKNIQGHRKRWTGF